MGMGIWKYWIQISFFHSWILKTAFKILYVLTPFFKIGNLVTTLKSPMQTRAPQKVPLLSSNGSFRCRKTFLGKIRSLRKTALFFYCNLFLILNINSSSTIRLQPIGQGYRKVWKIGGGVHKSQILWLLGNLIDEIK